MTSVMMSTKSCSPAPVCIGLILSVSAENLDVHRLAVYFLTLIILMLMEHAEVRRGDGRHRGWRRPGRADDRRAAGRGGGSGLMSTSAAVSPPGSSGARL